MSWALGSTRQGSLKMNKQKLYLLNPDRYTLSTSNVYLASI